LDVSHEKGCRNIHERIGLSHEEEARCLKIEEEMKKSFLVVCFPFMGGWANV
jgi:hypothetical protein